MRFAVGLIVATPRVGLIRQSLGQRQQSWAELIGVVEGRVPELPNAQFHGKQWHTRTGGAGQTSSQTMTVIRPDENFDDIRTRR